MISSNEIYFFEILDFGVNKEIQNFSSTESVLKKAIEKSMKEKVQIKNEKLVSNSFFCRS